MVDFLTSTIGCGTATLLGKSVVASLLKFLPGVGTIIGGTISGGIAAALTTALGKLYIQIIEKIYNGEYNIKSMDHEKFKQIVSTMYKKNLKKEPCQF
ncbi:hypothetical protein M9Y10_007444 [Tritrichomonas musculus]|uniref:GTPase n=1 Tax=Tritrichomonas musculus TaxID=1915356 RepID=A0ABR2J1K1_9EUKA